MISAAFLDRDGTINVDKHYLYKIENFEFIPGAVEGLRILQDMGYSLFIITNQSGIAKGYYTEEELALLNNWLIEYLSREGVRIEKIYYCPHHPQAIVPKYRLECNCRKPRLELYYRAAREYNINIDNSIAIGDKMRDLCICMESGCKGFLVGTNEEKSRIIKVKSGSYKGIGYGVDLLQIATLLAGNEEF